MKEFIEKLIGRLEEASHWEEDKFDEDGYCNDDSEEVIYLHTAIEIVNQLAEEFGKDINVVSNGWIPCSERLPEDDTKNYIVQTTNGFIDILRFTKDAYKLCKYDFYEYKGKKKALFYDWDSEYGYIERECVAWMPLLEPYQPKGE